MFGASSAFRWVKCPPSALKPDDYEDVSSDAAIAGTRAHAWLAYLLDEGAAHGNAWPVDYVGLAHPEDEKNVLDADTAEAIGVAVAYVASVLHTSPDAELFVEKTWHAADIHPDAFGTADVVIRMPHGSVIVVDYKNGTHKVPVALNYQLMFYGVASRGAGQNVNGVIVQRSWNGGATIDKHTFSEDELQTFVFDAAMAAASADPNGEHVAGRHCKFCWKATTCSAMALEMDIVSAEPFPHGLTPETAPAAMARAALAEAYAGAVAAEAYSLAMRGTPPNGYKLVEGRASREWVAPDAPQELERESGVKMSRTEWLSVAQAEKTLGKKRSGELMRDLIVRTPGKPKLVTAEAPGEPITQSGGNFRPLNL